MTNSLHWVGRKPTTFLKESLSRNYEINVGPKAKVYIYVGQAVDTSKGPKNLFSFVVYKEKYQRTWNLCGFPEYAPAGIHIKDLRRDLGVFKTTKEAMHYAETLLALENSDG